MIRAVISTGADISREAIVIRDKWLRRRAGTDPTQAAAPWIDHPVFRNAGNRAVQFPDRQQRRVSRATGTNRAGTRSPRNVFTTTEASEVSSSVVVGVVFAGKTPIGSNARLPHSSINAATRSGYQTTGFRRAFIMPV